MKVTFVGGGSYNWSPTLIKDFLLREGLEETEYCLLDIDLEAARMLKAYGEKANALFDKGCRFVATDDQDEAFDGADFVVITISTGGLEAMRYDLEIPEKYRIYHTVGDTCGPAGWARAVRNVPVFVEMGRKIAQRSPQAVVLNYTNPMTVLTDVLCRVSGLRVVGLCHGLYSVYSLLQKLFHLESEAQIKCRVAGINHFFWVLDFTIDGRPGYPLLREKLAGRTLAELVREYQADEMGYRSHVDVASELLELVGYLPYVGDRHTSEFFAHYLTGEEEDLARYHLERTFVQQRMANVGKRRKWVQEVLAGREPIPDRPSREAAADIVHAIVTGQDFVDVMNVPNIGQVENLPHGAVVETLGMINALGFTPLCAGALPPPVLDMVLPHVRNQMRLVEGMLSHNRKMVYDSLIHDPLCSHLTYPERMQMGRELLAANRELVPDFMLD